VNEDAVLVLSGDQADLPETDLIFVVADGMGGMQFGDVASREAVRVVRETLVARLATPGADPEAALDHALKQANDAVRVLAGKPAADAANGTEGAAEAATTEEPEAAAAAGGVMGTTCVAGVLQEDQLYLVHVGDSRAYLLRDGHLGRLTHDHSFVEERVRAGDLTEDEARRSRFRNMITRAIGIDAVLAPDPRRDTLAPGDTLLVCTDGLTTMLTTRRSRPRSSSPFPRERARRPGRSSTWTPRRAP
jgi:protein phosphatase